MRSSIVIPNQVAGLANIQMVPKGADQQVASSTALQNDDALLAALAANETLKFLLACAFSGSSGGDINFAFTVPAGAAIRWGPISGVQFTAGAAVLWPDDITASGATMNWGASASGDRRFGLIGEAINGATPGNLQFQWAQNTSNATPTIVRANSFLLLLRQ